MSTDTLAPTIDVRELPGPQRHPVLFERFQQLAPGEGFVLLNDHEPLPLQQQFTALWPGQFNWQVLAAGPAEWRILITRRSAGKSCCGCCGG